MNLKGYGSGHGLILRYYPGIFLEGLSKTMKKLSKDSCSMGQGLNRNLPNMKQEY
jgi:hypothetical protein